MQELSKDSFLELVRESFDSIPLATLGSLFRTKHLYIESEKNKKQEP